MADGLYMEDGDRRRPGADAAWRNLALLADCTTGEVTGQRLAAGLSRDGKATQSSLAIRNLLHEILLGDTAGPADSILAGLSDLILSLDPAILVTVMRAENDQSRRLEFMLAAAERLPVRALQRVTAGLAAALERDYPSAVRSLIHRLARRALALPQPSAAEAEKLLREQLALLFRSWTTRPGTMPERASRRPQRSQRRPAGRTTPEADRILEMAIECGATGGGVWAALQEVVDDGGTATVIDRIKKAPDDSPTAAAVMKRIGTPQELQRLLRTDPFDGAAVDALLRGLGLSAAKVMLEELVESTNRLTRRYLMERLARFGPEIRPLVEGRLKDQRWFVQRNMLALLRSAGCPADSPTVKRFMASKDARIRRETVLWGLDNPATRDEVLARALSDHDAAVLRPSLQSARGGLPAAAVPALARRLVDPDFPPEFRVLSINLLGRADSVLALEALLHFAQNGTTLLGKPRLAARSPEMLAAIGVIARSWSSERRAAALLAQAAKSKDPGIMEALRGTMARAS